MTNLRLLPFVKYVLICSLVRRFLLFVYCSPTCALIRGQKLTSASRSTNTAWRGSYVTGGFASTLLQHLFPERGSGIQTILASLSRSRNHLMIQLTHFHRQAALLKLLIKHQLEKEDEDEPRSVAGQKQKGRSNKRCTHVT